MTAGSMWWSCPRGHRWPRSGRRGVQRPDCRSAVRDDVNGSRYSGDVRPTGAITLTASLTPPPSPPAQPAALRRGRTVERVRRDGGWIAKHSGGGGQTSFAEADPLLAHEHCCRRRNRDCGRGPGGALLVGDSVRGSLRDLMAERPVA